MLRLLRGIATSTCLLLLAALGLVAVPSTAAAASTLLCTGYVGCGSLGMSDAGYSRASGTMWWRMFTGHNCTNYVAYRMVQSGLPNTRPWSGGGNARYWGTSNAELTDDVPTVGSVAWWGAYVKPAGAAGHVAYVEQVVSPDEIIVSQDSWGGDFSWARITRDSGRWPSGFVHFNDLALTNTAPPVVSGETRVGSMLTATPGTWNATDLVYRYIWKAGRRKIATATGPTVQLTTAEQGKKIRVKVTATKAGYYETTAASPRTAAVEPGSITSTAPPTVTGDAEVDGTLTSTAGSWFPEPTAVTYQWSADGVPVPGATGSSFVPGPDQVGRVVTVAVTASKEGYTDVSALSGATAPVAPGTFSATSPATVRGTARPGQTLTFTPARYTPAGNVAVQWYRGALAVPGATASTYDVSNEDLGERVTATMTITRPGYTPLELRAPWSARVKADSTIAVKPEQRRHGLGLAVTVAAPGVADVAGVMRVTFRGEVIKTKRVRDGHATVLLKGLPAGSRKVKVRFVSTLSVRGSTWKERVRVR
ncbi:MAG: CHAP domain-containing protein [Nocardioides sp.]